MSVSWLVYSPNDVFFKVRILRITNDFEVKTPIARISIANGGGAITCFLDAYDSSLRAQPEDPGTLKVLDSVILGAKRHVGVSQMARAGAAQLYATALMGGLLSSSCCLVRPLMAL